MPGFLVYEAPACSRGVVSFFTAPGRFFVSPITTTPRLLAKPAFVPANGATGTVIPPSRNPKGTKLLCNQLGYVELDEDRLGFRGDAAFEL